MQAYGYQWSQATVTRLESATRPIRVNELADLALLFDVSVTQFLAPDIAKSERDDLDALEREIADLARRRAVVEKDAESEAVLAAAAAAAHARELADLARIDGRLAVLKQWHPRFAEIAEAATGEADRREQSQP